MIRILLVDDQRLVRRCIAARLNAVENFEVAGEANSGEAARKEVREHDYDIVLMDLNMPGMGGIEATRRLIAADENVRIIGLSMYVSGPLPRHFLTSGGAGYVSKNADTDELVGAIREVHAGNCYISKDVAQHIAAVDSRRVNPSGVDMLSAREVQVLQHIASGLSTDSIGSRLNLSVKTVAHHRRHLLSKLQVENDVQLATIAREYGIVDIEPLSHA